MRDEPVLLDALLAYHDACFPYLQIASDKVRRVHGLMSGHCVGVQVIDYYKTKTVELKADAPQEAVAEQIKKAL